MRVIIAGGGDTGIELANALISEGHEVIVIEKDKQRAEELAERLDCLVIHGNAAHPQVLKDSGIDQADALIAMTGNDRDNVIISLIAKTMGVKRIITKIEDTGYNDLLIYMGINNIINPSRLISFQALSILKDFNILNLSIILRGDTRLLPIKIAKELDGKKIKELDIDYDKARPILILRGDESLFIDENTTIRYNDIILFLVKAKYQDELLRKLAEEPK